MGYTLYIIYSGIIDRYYTGVSSNIEERLSRHNKGTSRSTRKGAPGWAIVYEEKYTSRSEAMKREFYIKRMKSRSYIEHLIEIGKDKD